MVLLVPSGVRWQNIGRAWPPRAVIALTVIACLSAPFGLSLGASGTFLLNVYLRIALFCLMLVVAMRGIRDLSLFVWAYVASAATLAVLSLTVMEIATTAGSDARLVSSYMYDANDLGMIFLTAVPLGVLLFKSFEDWRRWAAMVALMLLTGGLAMTGSRGAFVGFLVVLPAIFMALKDVTISKRVGVVMALVGALVVGAPEGYWERIETVFQPSDDYNVTSDYGRLAIAKRGIGYMVQYPVLGVGVANFPRAEGTISPLARNAAAGEAIRFLAPHNTYVQVGAELGLPALIIWLSLLWAGIVGLRPLRKRLAALSDPGRDEQFLLMACTYLPISFLAFATTSFFVSHAYTPVFYVMLALLVGTQIFTRATLRQRRVVRSEPPPAIGRAGRRRFRSAR